MMIGYLAAWFAAITCAALGCTLPAVVFVVVAIVIIFRWELLRLLALFGPRAPLTDG